jgi:hypothetical protein
MGPLKIDDADFWADEIVISSRDAIVGEIQSRDDPRGLVIDAPSKADVDRYETLPVIGFYVRRMLDDQVTSFDHSSIAVAVDLGTNHVRVAPAFDRGKLLAPPEHPPIPVMNSVTTVDMFNGDWRVAAGMPWEPGQHRLSLILREFLSNQVEIELERTLKFDDPEVAAYLDAQREKRPPPPPKIYPPHPKPTEWGDEAPDAVGWLPKYLEADGSPAIPDEPGLSLDVERVQMPGDSGRCVLFGSFRVPILEREVLMSSDRGYPDVGDPAANAVVPITLVVTGSEAMGPFVFRLQVPTYDSIDLAEDPCLVSGQFTVDLVSLGLPRSPQTYFITAFNGSHVCGPVPFAFVSEDMLRHV